MKLQEFITEALLEITSGIVEAQKRSQLHIAPGSVEGVKVTDPQMVKFELSVSTNKDGGGSINVLGMGELGGQLSSEEVQSVSFEVPVHFNAPTPMNTIKSHKALSTPGAKGS
ncbi:MAG: hypothetical protein QNJ16_09495 [Rhodobacter sp.]|nr:hypothetical protein [Rhodobacter sp.]